MKKLLVALFMAVFAVGFAGCATEQPKQEAKGPLWKKDAPKAMGDKSAADAAMAEAKKELAAVKKAGHEWLLIDKATGRTSLSKLLKKAEELYKENNFAEAERLAKKVTWGAKMGLEQDKLQAHAAPHYPSQ